MPLHHNYGEMEVARVDIDLVIEPKSAEEWENSWPVRKRNAARTGRIPFGYYINPEDEFELLPDPKIIPYLDKALNYLDNNATLREVADWLIVKTSKDITHAGLRYIWTDKRGHLDTPRARRSKELKEGVEKSRTKTRNYKRGRKIAGIKAAIKHRENALQKLKAKEERKEQVVGRDIETIAYDFESVPEEKEVIWKPNPGPQTDFLAAPEREVLYGGAAGGGKSAALLADPMRYFGNKNFVGLLLRRTNDELKELKWESQKLYPKAIPGAKWREKDSTWIFPSGARLWMSFLDRDDDVLRYHGQAFTWIGVDELTQYSTPFAWDYLRSRLRTTDEELKPYLCMRATTNPGGPGHHWVKKMFVDPAPSNVPFAATDIQTGEKLLHPQTKKPLFSRRFIPAKLYDNPYLAHDGAYESNLLSLPEDQRRKLLEGDWSVLEGAAFPDFSLSTHVIEPFEIPSNWRRFRSGDYGYASHSAVLWFAIDPSGDNRLIVYRELYVSKHTGKDLAREVLNAERGEKIDYGILDSSVWHQRGHLGPSIAEEMIGYGCRWRPSDRSQGSRIAGKNRLHELLKVDEYLDQPGIQIFNTCRQLISDLQNIPSDPKGGDDIDSRYTSDHTYDALRYGIMSRPNGTIFDESFSTPHYRPADSAFGY